MTANEYIQKMRSVNERRCALDKEEKAIMTEYANSMPFKKDDYISIIDNEYSTEDVWIERIEACGWSSDRVNLYVNGHKKNGERSKTARIYPCVPIRSIRLVKPNNSED